MASTSAEAAVAPTADASVVNATSTTGVTPPNQTSVALNHDLQASITDAQNADFGEAEELDMSTKPVKALIIGAGRRADVYSDFARKNPNLLKIVGVADPNQYRRERMALLHLLPFDKLFISWICVPEEKIADIAIISTMENLRLEVVHSFAQKGYAIILEKPMAQSYTECKKIFDVCQEYNVIFAVAHVLRYDPHVVKILDIVEKGVLGEMISIDHTNPIGWFHFAHSHVRGKWAEVSKSSSLLVNKCCHDMDFIRCLQPGVEIRSIFSVGSLVHFKEENKPPAAGTVCVGCSAEETCPYAATRIYLKRVREGYRDWPVNEVTDFPDIETVTDALLRGPYGKCVYEQRNDAVDNQVVLMQFDSGVSATLTVNAFTEKVNIRRTIIRGSKGELSCNFDESFIRVFDFIKRDYVIYHLNNETEVSSPTLVASRDADKAFIYAFLDAVKSKSSSGLVSQGKDCLKTYLYLFGAERSRQTNKIVNPVQEESIFE